MNSTLLERLVQLDLEIARAEGWMTAEDLYYSREAEAELESERAYERYLENRCADEYAIIERDAPWAL